MAFKNVIIFLIAFALLNSCKIEFLNPFDSEMNPETWTPINFSVNDSSSGVTSIEWEENAEFNISGYKLIVNSKNKSTETVLSKTTRNYNLICSNYYGLEFYAYAGENKSNSHTFNRNTANIGTASLTTSLVSSITISSAASGGNITCDGGSSIIMRGVCYSTSHNPTISNNVINSGSGLGAFASNLAGLNASTKYYARAFATNGVSTSYGNQVSFTTANINIASLTTSLVSSITASSAVAGGNVTSDGGSLVIMRGMCYDYYQNPTISDNVINSGSGLGAFASNLTALYEGTKYYARAFATNSVGTAYGNQVSFTTANINIASLTTSLVSSITASSAVAGGNVTSDGGSLVTMRGMCYSTSQNPTISNNVINSGSGLGAFASNLTALNAGTKYYARAFATNVVGTAYGNQINFTTSLPNKICNNTAITTGTTYAIQTSSQSYFTQGEPYTITMYSSIYSFGQASSVKLYDSDVFIYSFGSWLVFATNTRTFTLPSSIPVSNCYNIRVVKGSDLYVSPIFTIVP